MTTWFSCSSRKAARGQHVKLVFPGGHVELLDRPTLAVDVMARHPRFCVGRPDVFREPARGCGRGRRAGRRPAARAQVLRRAVPHRAEAAEVLRRIDLNLILPRRRQAWQQ